MKSESGNIRIFGIDPGLATVGFAVLEINGRQKNLLSAGVIRTKAKEKQALRLQEIYKDISSLIEEYKPKMAAIEQIFFSKNVSTGIHVSEARGVILLALQEAGLEIYEFNPSAMKAALTGNGKAEKKDIQKMVMMELGLSEPPKPDDAADAVSLALTLASQLR